MASLSGWIWNLKLVTETVGKEVQILAESRLLQERSRKEHSVGEIHVGMPIDLPASVNARAVANVSCVAQT